MYLIATHTAREKLNTLTERQLQDGAVGNIPAKVVQNQQKNIWKIILFRDHLGLGSVSQPYHSLTVKDFSNVQLFNFCEPVTTQILVLV